MANKTIYVRDSDLPLWESAQAELGESVSALFGQFLRERFKKMDAFVHVLHSSPTASEDFTVMFAPVGHTGSGGPMKPNYVHGTKQLKELLEAWGVALEVITQVESQLKEERSISVRATLLRASIGLEPREPETMVERIAKYKRERQVVTVRGEISADLRLNAMVNKRWPGESECQIVDFKDTYVEFLRLGPSIHESVALKYLTESRDDSRHRPMFIVDARGV